MTTFPVSHWGKVIQPDPINFYSGSTDNCADHSATVYAQDYPNSSPTGVITLTGGFSNLTAVLGGNCNGISINGAAYVNGPVTGVNSGDTIDIRQQASPGNNSSTTAWVIVGTTESTHWIVKTPPLHGVCN